MWTSIRSLTLAAALLLFGLDVKKNVFRQIFCFFLCISNYYRKRFTKITDTIECQNRLIHWDIIWPI